VATDTRLWLYTQLQQIRGSLQELITVATNRAEAEADVLMPGGCCGGLLGEAVALICERLQLQVQEAV
jgi:hypothetical protein